MLAENGWKIPDPDRVPSPTRTDSGGEGSRRARTAALPGSGMGAADPARRSRVRRSAGASLGGAARGGPDPGPGPGPVRRRAARARTACSRPATWPAPRATTRATPTVSASTGRTPARRSRRRWRCCGSCAGRRAHAQLIGGEVTLLPPDDHAAVSADHAPVRAGADEHDPRRRRRRLPRTPRPRPGRAPAAGPRVVRRALRLADVRPARHPAPAGRGVAAPLPAAVRRAVPPGCAASTGSGSSWRTT